MSRMEGRYAVGAEGGVVAGQDDRSPVEVRGEVLQVVVQLHRRCGVERVGRLALVEADESRRCQTLEMNKRPVLARPMSSMSR